MEKDFEVHIVAYENSDLTNVPKPYFLNEIHRSTQGFSSIATVESNDLSEAYREFEQGVRWSEEQLHKQKNFGVHVKLEAMKKQVKINKPVLEKIPQLRKVKFSYIESPLVSAWDVHLDGFFDSRLKDQLHNDGYIVLDYLSSKSEEVSSLTLHFLRQEECIEEFNRIQKLVAQCGGFEGIIYYEDPLAFVVYGNTIARPIIESIKN